MQKGPTSVIWECLKYLPVFGVNGVHGKGVLLRCECQYSLMKIKKAFFQFPVAEYRVLSPGYLIQTRLQLHCIVVTCH
jgi:hypothetical protein